MKLPKISFEFLKNNKQIILSFLVIILVPALVVLNTYYLLSGTRKAFDTELRSKAEMAANGLNVAVLDSLDSEQGLKERVADYVRLTDNVKKIILVQKIDDNFTVYISPNADEVGKPVPDAEKNLYVLSWYNNDDKSSYAKFTVSSVNETVEGKSIKAGEQFWTVITPLKDANGQKTYLAKVMVSVEGVNSLYNSTQQKAIILTILIIVAIVVMVFANGQLFQYSILFTRLKEVDQMKDDFISIASHELRTPLTAIKGEIEMLEDDLKNHNLRPEQKLEIMQMAQISAKRLDDLVADILDVSRLEQGRMKFEPVKTDLISDLKEVNHDMEITAKEKGLKLIENYPKEKLYSNVDSNRLKQVLINLIGNAIKYTEKGEVEVTLSQEGELNKFVVRDTGMGMDESEREKLFTKFYRVQNDRTKDITGTGLGLWITKQIIEQMGGKIMVDSIKDVGSEFTVTFPKV